MNKMIRLPIILLVITIGVTLYGQLLPNEAILQMGRGINLGNTLEPPDEGGWNNPPVESYYFDDYVSAGFTSVRIPVSWYGHTLETSPYTIDAAWMNRIETIVDWGLNRKLLIILNAHHESWLKNDPTAQNLERFDSIWSQISVRFKDKSDSLFFEILNEPYPMLKDTVDNLNERILSIIRRTNPTRIVIFSGHKWSNSEELITARIPDDNYLIGYFHSYDPWSFAGEANGTWGTSSDMNNLINKFSIARTWSETNHIPVLLGEFGAIKTCDYNSRMKHYAAYTEQAAAHGFSFAAWDDGGDFRIYQRQSRGWNEIKDILINYSSLHPLYFNVKNKNGELVELSWNNRMPGCDSIFIYRGTDPLVLSGIGAVDATIDTYSDTTIDKNKTYYYQISSFRKDTTELFSYPQKVITDYTSSFKYINDMKVSVYPNPVGNTLTINFDDNEGNIMLQIFDINGKLRLTRMISENQETFSVENLEPGTYILNLKKDESEYSTRIKKL